MDSFKFSSKVEKAKAIKKCRKLQNLAGLLRILEICIVLIFLSGFSVQLPFDVKNSSGYFKNLTLNLLSPWFIFVIGNVIIITLFIKSGQDRNGGSSRNDLYEEFIEKSKIIHHPVVENREKQGNCVFQHVAAGDTNACRNVREKRYERSQSENFGRPRYGKPGRELRRSATRSCREIVVAVAAAAAVDSSVHEDRMSSEEFKSTVEAFIERQKRFRRDEENSIF